MICELTNVQKKYKDKVVLDNFNLKVNEGEKIAIVGKSGAGKSTLLNIIGLLEKPDDGAVILFDDKQALKKRKYYLRNKITYLFQNYGLIENENIIQNLNIALTYTRKKKCEKKQLIKKALVDVGLQYMSGCEKIYTLSGGEQQRVALARTFLKPSELILADEPTGSLDEANRDLFLNLLSSDALKEKTFIVVTHDNTVASYCDRLMNI